MKKDEKLCYLLLKSKNLLALPKAQPEIPTYKMEPVELLIRDLVIQVLVITAGIIVILALFF